MKQQLKPQDVMALAEFWSIFWAATVLNPRGCQAYRGTMAQLGLVERRGKLRLTKAGERALALAQGR